jgi:REP element-mobilizing transposase RayT
MKQLHVFEQGVWYEIRTCVNNRELLLLQQEALSLLTEVVREAESRFDFEIGSLRVDDGWFVFFIKPADAEQLPAIVKRIKQTFAARFNRMTGRSGHVWGNRYRACVVGRELPKEAGAAACGRGVDES